MDKALICSDSLPFINIPFPSLLNADLSYLIRGVSNFPQPDEKEVEIHQGHGFHLSAFWKVKEKKEEKTALNFTNHRCDCFCPALNLPVVSRI